MNFGSGMEKTVMERLSEMKNKTTMEEIEEVKGFFDRMSQSEDDVKKIGLLKKHTDLILKFFDKKDLSNVSVLELGCGAGGLLIKFLEMGAIQTFGMDISEVTIKNAQILAKAKDREDQTNYFFGDFNSENKIFPVDEIDIAIADRVFCCSPVALELLERMIQFHPQYLIIVLPRKNPIIKKLNSIKTKLLTWRLGSSHWYFHSVKDIDRICESHGFTRVYQRFRYVWEVLIYQKHREG
jgi:SAM-dependent methyltransferase